jgi:hypothetical protein
MNLEEFLVLIYARVDFPYQLSTPLTILLLGGLM